MRDIILNHISYEEGDYENPDHRINKIQKIGSGGAESGCEKYSNSVYEEFQQLGCESAYYAHKESQHYHELTLLYVMLTPDDKLHP